MDPEITIFYDKNRTTFLFRVSGEDAVLGILSNHEILQLNNWIADHGLEGALEQYTHGLRKASENVVEEGTQTVLSISIERPSYQERFESVFQDAVDRRLEGDRGQNSDSKEENLAKEYSRRPIREKDGRYYVVLENRSKKGLNAELISGSAAWNPADRDNEAILNIVDVQSFESQIPTTSISRGELLTQVLVKRWEDDEPISDGFIDALQEVNAEGGIEGQQIVDGVLEHYDSLSSSPVEQAS